MKHTTKHGLLTILIILAFTGCGGGGGGGGAVAPLAGGGISGTGTGTITGFGSVIINDIRTFAIDANTEISWDDETITEQQLIDRGVGAVATVNVGTDVSNDFTSGSAVSISVSNNVKGPVTSTSPLQVLGQTIVITGNTVFMVDDTPNPGFNPATLALGDTLEINGFADSNNVILVSLLELKTGGVPEWKLVGPVTAIGAGTYNVGVQQILDNVAPRDCGGGVSINDLVEIKATADPGFGPGNDILDTVTDVECKTPGLDVPANATGNILDAEVEGLVTGITTPSNFLVDGQRVVTDAGTLFEGGDANDIVLGTKLEAEGDLNITTGILAADKIRFRETRVRIESPANVPVAGLGSPFTLMDVITITSTPLTEDDDGLVDGSGNNGNRQVEVRGFVDKNGTVIAAEVRDRGTADPLDVRLRGPVGANTCNPAVADEEFDVLGVIIDTGDIGTLFQADDGATNLTQQQFCNLAVTGTPVQAENGVFSSAPARIDNADLIEIED